MGFQDMRRVGASFGASNVVPLKSKVKEAIHKAARELTAANLEEKKLGAPPIGTLLPADDLKLKDSEVTMSTLVCVVTGASSPWQKVDGNHAGQFYLSVGTGKAAVFHGPFDFVNPLLKTSTAAH